MGRRNIDKALRNEDHWGNNIAVACPRSNCGKVYVASDFLKDDGGRGKGHRTCPSCKKSWAFVSKTETYVEFED